MTDLKAETSQPNEVTRLQSTKQPQPIIQPTSSAPKEPDTSNTTQLVATTKKSSKLGGDKTEEDRKFNVVIYGINECNKGTPRNERLNHDLDKVTSIITQGDNSVSPLSIRDLLRLGKYRDQSKTSRPILVKLNRTIDVTTLLIKARSLPKEIRIKPDMSHEERLIESLLLKERWSLIQSGIERKVIRIRANKIFVKNKLHGQIIDSSFVPEQQQPSDTEMDSSNS